MDSLVVSTFWPLWITLVWTSMCFMWTYVFNSLGYIPRSVSAGSNGDSVEELPDCFKVAVWHCHQQCVRVLISPYPPNIYCPFSVTVSPVGFKWYLTAVLICSSLMKPVLSLACGSWHRTATPFLLCLHCPQPEDSNTWKPDIRSCYGHFLLHRDKPTSSPIQPMPTVWSLQAKGAVERQVRESWSVPPGQTVKRRASTKFLQEFLYISSFLCPHQNVSSMRAELPVHSLLCPWEVGT